MYVRFYLVFCYFRTKPNTKGLTISRKNVNTYGRAKNSKNSYNNLFSGFIFVQWFFFLQPKLLIVLVNYVCINMFVCYVGNALQLPEMTQTYICHVVFLTRVGGTRVIEQPSLKRTWTVVSVVLHSLRLRQIFVACNSNWLLWPQLWFIAY